MGELSPPLRLVLMLRHFSGVTAYEHIAEAYELPVGTVRSRLNQARAKMTSAQLATADSAHDNAEAPNKATHRDAVETLAAREAGWFGDVGAAEADRNLAKFANQHVEHPGVPDVLPEHRRRGIGTAVTAAAIEHAREHGLRVGTPRASSLGEPVYRRMASSRSRNTSHMTQSVGTPAS